MTFQEENEEEKDNVVHLKLASSNGDGYNWLLALPLDTTFLCRQKLKSNGHDVFVLNELTIMAKQGKAVVLQDHTLNIPGKSPDWIASDIFSKQFELYTILEEQEEDDEQRSGPVQPD